jgi:sec-independent protein translocase protein TatA
MTVSTLATLAFLQNMGMMEWIIIMVVLLLLFGRRLPEVGKSLGKGIVEFKKGINGVDDSVNNAGMQQPQYPAPQAQPAWGQQLPPGQQNPYAAQQLPPAQNQYQPQPYAQQPYQQPYQQQPQQPPAPQQGYPQPQQPPMPQQGYPQPQQYQVHPHQAPPMPPAR